MHHHIVGREDLVDVVDGHALGPAGGAGGIQPGRLVIDMRVKVDGRVGFGAARHIVPVSGMAGGQRRFGLAGHQDDLRPVAAQFQRLAGQRAELGVVDKNSGAAVVNDLRDLSPALAVIHRAGNGADLVGRQVAENKLRRVEQGKHHHVVFPHAVRPQCVCQAVGLGIQLPVVPAPAGQRVKQRRPAAKAGYIAQKAVQIGKPRLEGIAEHSHVISKLVLQIHSSLSGSDRRISPGTGQK